MWQGPGRWQPADQFIAMPQEASVVKQILIATDGSELAQKAVDQGLAFAKALRAKVVAVTVTEPWTMLGGLMPTPSIIDAYEKSSSAEAHRIIAAVDEAAKKSDV